LENPGLLEVTSGLQALKLNTPSENVENAGLEDGDDF